MKVKLISYSQPSEDMLNEGLENAQDLVAFCARVSNPSNQMNTETSEKLIRYLIKHKHWSPMEMVSVCLEIETTRDIGRQLLRHRSFSFQEFCLSGDTEIYFGVPHKIKDGKYKPTQKIKLSDLYDKWQNGSEPITDRYGNSRRISLKNRLREMYIKIYDENTKKLSTAHLKEVFQTGVKPLYEITLSDGKKIKTTKEHKFLTQSGFNTLENIVGLKMIGDRVVMSIKEPIIGVNGIVNYRDKNWLSERKQESLFLGGGISWIAKTYSINYNTLRKWFRIHGLQYSKIEVSKTIEPWNKGVFGYTTGQRTQSTRDKQRDSALARGENHNWYRGGHSKNRESLNGTDAKRFRDSCNHTCNRCGQYGGNSDIHHIVPVSVDPSLTHNMSNWELLCEKCHIDHHRKEDYTGWQNIGAIRKIENSYIPKWVTISKIEYIGEQQTYDIEVDHDSHNYVANGIVVHNSQRYADPTKDLAFTVRDARLQDTKNRQNSIPLDMTDDDQRRIAYQWEQGQLNLIKQSQDLYSWAIEKGIAKEQARAVLPEGLTMSRLYVNGSLRSWIHYIEVRADQSTQLEHREIAIECAKVIATVFPLAKDL